MFEFNHIKSLAGRILPNSQILSSEELVYGGIENPMNKRRIIISPLDELITLTKRVRQLIYSDHNDDSISGSRIDSKVKKILELSKLIIAQDIGGENAEEWQNSTYEKIRNIIAAEGPYGIFNGSNSIVKIQQEDNKVQFEIKEKLILPYGNKSLVIGNRTLKYGVSYDFISNWEVNVGFEGIFENMKNLVPLLDENDVYRTFHLYFWSDQPIENYQPYLVEQVLRDCLISFPSGSHSAITVLFISNDEFSNYELSHLTSRETLALNRALPGGKIYLSPGKNEDIFTDPVKKLNRPNSVFDSDYFEKAVKRVAELGVSEMRFLEASNVVIESTNDLVESSSIAIMSECWNGTWAKSLEIDGEQVII